MKYKSYTNKFDKPVGSLKSRSLSSFEVVTLFEEVLNSHYSTAIGRILKILGIYMLMDTNQLMQRYQKIYGEKLRLKYIKKAVNYNLISEFKYNSSTKGEKDIYFYKTKLSGRMYLKNINFKFNNMPLDSELHHIQQVLTLNEYLLSKGYILPQRGISDVKKGFYGTSKEQKRIMCYFSNKITKSELINILIKIVQDKVDSRNKDYDKIITKEDICHMFKFEPIEIPLIYFGDLTTGNFGSEIDEEELDYLCIESN